MTAGPHLHDALTGQHLTFLQTAAETGGELLQLEVRLDPGGWVPRHAHVRQDERVEVLEGTLTVGVGRKKSTLTVGESAQVPRRRIHVVRNAGDGPARFLLEVRPRAPHGASHAHAVHGDASGGAVGKTAASLKQRRLHLPQPRRDEGG